MHIFDLFSQSYRINKENKYFVDTKDFVATNLDENSMITIIIKIISLKAKTGV